MKERGVEVLDFHDLLAETLDDKEARKFVLDRRITAQRVGIQNRCADPAVARRDAIGANLPRF